VDDDTNSIVEWKWQLLPVDNNLAQPDLEIEKLIATFKEGVDRKYNRLIGRLARKLTHPRREEETELGNLFADIFAQLDSLDVVFVASGSIRGNQLGPLVTLSDLKTVFPYDDTLYKFRITGVHLVKIFTHIMRPENRIAGESQYFQVNKGIKAVYSDVLHRLESLSINGQSLQGDNQYTICMDGYRYHNSESNLGITHQELGTPKVITTSCQDVLEEYLSHHQNLDSRIEGRLVYK
jgi:5'-nucleotidase